MCCMWQENTCLVKSLAHACKTAWNIPKLRHVFLTLMLWSCCTRSNLPWQTSFSAYTGGCCRDHQLPRTGFFTNLTFPFKRIQAIDNTFICWAIVKCSPPGRAAPAGSSVPGARRSPSFFPSLLLRPRCSSRERPGGGSAAQRRTSGAPQAEGSGCRSAGGSA